MHVSCDLQHFATSRAAKDSGWHSIPTLSAPEPCYKLFLLHVPPNNVKGLRGFTLDEDSSHASRHDVPEMTCVVYCAS